MEPKQIYLIHRCNPNRSIWPIDGTQTDLFHSWMEPKQIYFDPQMEPKRIYLTNRWNPNRSILALRWNHKHIYLTHWWNPKQINFPDWWNPNRSIWSTDGTLTGTATTGQSRPGSNFNKGVTPHCPELQNSILTTWCELLSCFGYLFLFWMAILLLCRECSQRIFDPT